MKLLSFAVVLLVPILIPGFCYAEPSPWPGVQSEDLELFSALGDDAGWARTVESEVLTFIEQTWPDTEATVTCRADACMIVLTSTNRGDTSDVVEHIWESMPSKHGTYYDETTSDGRFQLTWFMSFQ